MRGMNDNYTHTLRLETNEVPKVVVRALSCGYLVVRLGLGRVDEVGEFDSVLDKEHGNCEGSQWCRCEACVTRHLLSLPTISQLPSSV